MLQTKKELLKICLFCRVFYLVAAALINFLFEDFDSSAWLHNDLTQYSIDENTTAAWTLTLNSAYSLNKWDSIYFNHISQHGYTYEQMLAFYPAFPYFVSYIVWAIETVVHLVPTMLLTQVTGIVVNSCLDIFATFILHRLTTRLVYKNEATTSRLKDNYIAIVTLTFIFNPANVFMTSSYTESMFVAAQLSCLLAMECGHFAVAVVLVALTTLTRSNGLLNIVFLVYFFLRHHVRSQNLFETLKLERSVLELLIPANFVRFLRISYKQLILLLLYVIAALTPYIANQYVIYRTFCKLPHVIASSTEREHWCQQTLPFSYSFIQSEYWGVGFLRYFEVKQVPNFILATPICLLMCLGVYVQAANNDFLPLVCNWLGLKDTGAEKFLTILSPDRIFVYMCHAFFLTIFGIFNVHVQILTRMLCSSSPILYWTAGELVLNNARGEMFRRRSSIFILCFFISFNIVGLFLHCNFYPWT